MRAILFAAMLAGLSTLASSPLEAADKSVDQAVPENAQIDTLADKFFALLKSGKSAEATTYAFSTSPLMSGRTADLQYLVGQIDNAVKIYGPVLGAEKVDEEVLGTVYVKRFYIARHANMLTRWEFEFGRVGGGWSILNFAFEDQIRTWR